MVCDAVVGMFSGFVFSTGQLEKYRNGWDNVVCWGFYVDQTSWTLFFDFGGQESFYCYVDMFSFTQLCTVFS
jgi:hypothetical protein